MPSILCKPQGTEYLCAKIIFYSNLQHEHTIEIIAGSISMQLFKLDAEKYISAWVIINSSAVLVNVLRCAQMLS